MTEELCEFEVRSALTRLELPHGDKSAVSCFLQVIP